MTIPMDDIEERILSGHTIRIERAVCIGSKNCIHLAPEVFELGTDQIVTFLENAEDIEPERLLEACRVCPVDALIAFDEAGHRIVPA